MDNVFLTSLTVPEVKELFRKELENYFSNNLPQAKQPEPDDLLTIQETAKFLSLAKATIYTLVSKSAIPAMKKGKRLYFSKKDITAWIQTGRKKTIKEVDQETDSLLSKKAN